MFIGIKNSENKIIGQDDMPLTLCSKLVAVCFQSAVFLKNYYEILPN